MQASLTMPNYISFWASLKPAVSILRFPGLNGWIKTGGINAGVATTITLTKAAFSGQS